MARRDTMAAPGPARLASTVQLQNRHWLRIAHHHQVVCLLEQVRIAGGIREISLALRRAEVTLRALQSVVEGLGD
jgi:hypothetical protein